MAERILVATVGGSPTPILQAIAHVRPTFVSFVASKTSQREVLEATSDRKEIPCADCGKSLPRSVDAPSIVAQAGLTPEQFDVLVVDDPDDFDLVVESVGRHLETLRSAYPHGEITCNYTGGTKSMTAGLVTAALERGDVSLSLVTGKRTDAVAVRGKGSKNRAVSVVNWAVRRTLADAAALFDLRDYASAKAVILDFTNRHELEASRAARLDAAWRLCQGFDDWDRFDHAGAFETLREFAKPLGDVFQDLLRLNGKGKASGYEEVFDLIRNAERRAERERFDDAVARLYRAVEMLAQVRLKGHQIDTGDVNLSALSATARERFAHRAGAKRVTLGLHDGYWLLSDLTDPFAAAYTANESNLRDALQNRNGSILAHGKSPIDRASYLHLHAAVHTLVDAAEAAGIAFGPRPRQFPKFADIPLG